MEERINVLFHSPRSVEMWKTWYAPNGRNQRPHIARVVRDAQLICERIGIKYDLHLEWACVLHDCAKNRTGYNGYPDHGLASAALAADILRGMLFLDDASCDEICAAIGDHDHQSTAPISRLSALLRAADAGKPSVGFYVRKSVTWCLKKGRMTLAEAYQNAFDRVKSGKFVLGKDTSKVAIRSYELGFAPELKAAMKQAEEISSPDEIPGIIAAYEASVDCEVPDA